MVRLWGAAQLFERFQHTHVLYMIHASPHIPSSAFTAILFTFHHQHHYQSLLNGIKHLLTFSFTNKPRYRPHSLCSVFLPVLPDVFGWHSQPAVTEWAESCSHVGQDGVRGGTWLVWSDGLWLPETGADEYNRLLRLVTLWSFQHENVLTPNQESKTGLK